MIGPTGVGKTEIARRLAKLAQAPFIKVEATKFTEVGYVGRDVEQIIRDLVEAGISLLRDKRREEVAAQAHHNAEERVVDALVGSSATASTRETFRKKLHANELDDREIEIELSGSSSGPGMFEIPGVPGANVGMINIQDMIGKALGGRGVKRKIKVKDAHAPLLAEEADKLLDQDQLTREAIDLVENHGIAFIDEIDKVANREGYGTGPSREGVQRDLLPLIEGTTVSTKYGPVKTDHILFIASGAFHVAKPSDLLPELQGRLPIRVELKAARQGRPDPHPQRHRRIADQAVRGADEDRGRDPRLHRRRGRCDRRRGGAGELQRREHRRPPAVDGDGAARRGDLVRRAGPPGRSHQDRRGLCARQDRQPRRRPRPQPVRAVAPDVRDHEGRDQLPAFRLGAT